MPASRPTNDIVIDAQSVEAFPYFARRYDVSCHSAVPKLNVTGIAFRECGYRLDKPTRWTIPFAVGIRF